MYPVYKRSYPDFDMPYDTLISVTKDIGLAKMQREIKNWNRTEEDLRAEIYYHVGEEIPVLK